MLGAAASLAMLSPVVRSVVELDTDKNLEIDANSPVRGRDGIIPLELRDY